MRAILAKRWVWTTALFAALNVAGLIAIVSAIRGRSAALRIEKAEPEGECAPDATARVRFNQLMVTEQEVGRELAEGMVTLTPPIRGRWTWADRLTASFQPAERLTMGTPFVATVSRKLTSLLGHSLASDATFQFHTAPLRLVRARQTALNRWGELSVALEFNDKVVPDAAQGHIALSGAGNKAVGFYVASHAPSHAVMLTTRPFAEESLTVTVRKGLRGVGGPLGLEEDQVVKLQLESDLRIEEVRARSRGPNDVYIAVECNQPLDLDAAAASIQVEPAADFRVLPSYDGFKLAGAFEPSRRYRITFQRGLAARNGSGLARDVVRSVVIPDLPPSLHFRTHGLYLSAQSSLVLPLEAVNVPEAQLTIQQVYPNNVVHYIRDASSYRGPRELCRARHEETLTFSKKSNEVCVTELDLRKMLGSDACGVFVADISSPKVRWGSAESRLIFITDLGLTVKRSQADLLVWVNTLSTAEPVAGASVAVYSLANQQILSGTTDEHGIAHFRDVDWSDERQPFAVAATKGSDTGYIEVGSAELSCAELDTGGRPYLAKGYEAFVYTDRGAYRPGSKVAVHAIVRGKDTSAPLSAGLSVPEPFPVQFRVTRPDGRLFKTLPAKLSQWGSADAQVDVPAYALTGRYAVELRLPGAESPIGSETFQVEEFVPDRMEVAIKAETRRYQAGQELAFTVQATHLFGAPAAEREVEAQCEFIGAEFTHPDFPGCRFADGAKKFASVSQKLGTALLDKNGEKLFTVKIPDRMAPPSAAMAVITASVKEIGGRAVTTRMLLDVDCYPHYIGLARASKDYARAQAPDKLLCVAIRPDGSPVERLELEGTACRVIWNTVLKLDDGHYRFVSEREEKQIAELACTITNGRGEATFTPPDLGEYIIRFCHKGSGASADVRFYCAGVGDVPWAMDKPARVELAADRAAYAPGGTARILVKAPFPGRALFTVEGERIHLARVMAMESNTAEFTFPVSDAFGPNAYCTATVIRRSAPGGQWAVQRAYGAIPVMLDTASRRLKVEVEGPKETRPGGPLHVSVRVRDAGGSGRKAEVTLAAVDEGICQLTSFATPDPCGFFFAKRRLAVATSDIYSLLMPEPEKRKVGADSAPGGDGGDEYDPRLFNPVSVERVKQVALWHSAIETGDDGNADVVLDVPEFTGQLRLMAVAAAGGEFGSCEQPTLVKQPLMVQASFPRFLAPGDEFTVPVTIFNNTSQSGAVALEAQCTGGLEILSDAPQRAQVESGHETTVHFGVRAPLVPGPASLAIQASLGAEQATATVEIPVRPPATLQSASGSGSATAAQPAELTLPGDWVKGTERYWLSFAPLPALRLGSSLQYLLRYPYGCVEQTTSASFPLLYLGDVAKIVEPDLDGKEIETLVQAGIDRVFSMQTYNGGFGYWPGYAQVYPWGSAYATHFLVEARKAGYDIPKDNLDSGIAFLDESLARDHDDPSLPTKAYACFVLALADKPNRSWTFRLHELRDELPAYSRFHLAAALALMKEDKLARELLAAAALPPVTKQRDTGGVLHSTAREAAILLSVYLDLKQDDPNVPLLVKRLSDAMENGRWASTQENAFAVMALGKYARRLASDKSDFRAEITAGSERLASLTSHDSVLVKPKDIGGKAIRIAVQGTGALYYYWGAEGIPTRETLEERDTSLKVRRRFLTRTGAELDPRQIRQGEIAVVELTVTNGVAVSNLVINDLLPACFEIENPRLATSELVRVNELAPRVSGEAEAVVEPDDEAPTLVPDTPAAQPDPQSDARSLCADRVEMRDDRLLLFANLRGTGAWRYRYVVRAVTCGRFRLPAVSAFCMYHPAICSIHGAGTVEVTGRQ